MKLRTTHNSIRIRVRKSELASLQKEHFIQESIQFPSNICFKFAIEISFEQEQLEASLENHHLVLSIPQKEAAQWISSSQVGIEKHLQVANNEQLHILIEKDFPCLDRENEDKSDTFWELVPEKTDAC
ncbi:MAG: hypothetical protein AAF806_20520 [Bacteroidota bacterium]